MQTTQLAKVHLAGWQWSPLSPQDREGQLQPGRTPLRGVREPGAVAGMGFVPVGVP